MFFNWLESLIDNAVNKVGNVVKGLSNWFGDTFGNLWDATRNFFAKLFKPILDLIFGIFYLFDKLLIIVVTLIKILWYFIELILSLGVGLFNTIADFGRYSGSVSNVNLGHMSDGYSMFLNTFSGFGFNILAYILTVFVFFFTTMGVMKIVGSRGD